MEIPLKPGGTALPERVDVEDRREVGEALVTRVVEPLPDRPLRELAVAGERPHVVRSAEPALPGQRDPDRDRETLAERARRDIDPWDDRRRMPLEPAPALPERHELLVRDRAGGAEERVVERRGMALAEDQVIVGRVLRLGPVVAEVAGEENGDQVGRRQRRRRMAGARDRRAADRVGAQLARERLVDVEVSHDPSYAGLFSTVIAKSRPSQRSAAGQKNVNRMGAAWRRAIGTSTNSSIRSRVRDGVWRDAGGAGGRPDIIGRLSPRVVCSRAALPSGGSPFRPTPSTRDSSAWPPAHSFETSPRRCPECRPRSPARSW